MSPRRFRLDGATLAEVKQKVIDEYGPEARIVAAEQITTGGVAGFFASRRYEVTVEVADGPTPSVDAHDLSPERRFGLAALLDDADAAESALGSSVGGSSSGVSGSGVSGSGVSGSAGAGSGAAVPGVSASSPDAASMAARAAADARLTAARETSAAAADARKRILDDLPIVPDAANLVSTSGRSFAAVLDGLQSVTELPEHPLPGTITAKTPPRNLPAAPPLLAGAGDLVAIAGLPADALAVARAMTFAVDADLVVCGTAIAEGLPRIDGRREAITARAAAVQSDRIVIAVFGISGVGVDTRDTLAENAHALAALKADQLWLAVDAGRKHDDTERWVASVASATTPDAVAGIGRDGTATPDTIRELGYAVSWSYGS